MYYRVTVQKGDQREGKRVRAEDAREAVNRDRRERKRQQNYKEATMSR